MSTTAIVLSFGFFMLAIVTLATVVKWFEVRRAATWAEAPGKVISARAVARKVRGADSHERAVAGDDLETRNFAEVTYEYHVGTRTYRGKRFSVGEDLGNFQVAERLARYPVGTPVAVWYNPEKPAEAVLERDAPEGVFRTMAIFIAVLAALLLAATLGTRELASALQANMARPERAVAVVALAGMALLIALITRVAEKRIETARDWPLAEGVIVASGVEEVRVHDSGSGVGALPRRTLYRAEVLYRYKVGAADLVGSRVDFGPRVYSSLRRLAGRTTESRPAGTRVVVHYDPANSADSVLDLSPRGLWIGWVAAAALAAGAVLLAF